MRYLFPMQVCLRSAAHPTNIRQRDRGDRGKMFEELIMSHSRFAAPGVAVCGATPGLFLIADDSLASGNKQRFIEGMLTTPKKIDDTAAVVFWYVQPI